MYKLYKLLYKLYTRKGLTEISTYDIIYQIQKQGVHMMKNDIKDAQTAYKYMHEIYGINYMGIYTLQINDMYYVGETLSYHSRLDTHYKDLLKSRHHNIYLQKEFNNTTKVYCDISDKYSMENHLTNHEERFIANVMLLSYEKYFIKILLKNNKKVANIEWTFDKIYLKAGQKLKDIMDLIYYIVSINIEQRMEDVFMFLLSSCAEYNIDDIDVEFNQLRSIK